MALQHSVLVCLIIDGLRWSMPPFHGTTCTTRCNDAAVSVHMSAWQVVAGASLVRACVGNLVGAVPATHALRDSRSTPCVP
jgi:acyl dehydratase